MSLEKFFWWTEEQKQLADEVEEFGKEIVTRATELRWKEEFPRDLIEKAAKKGWFGALIPKEYGGMGLGCTGCCIIAEGLLPVTTYYATTAFGGAHQIAHSGTEEQKKRWLPRIARGELIGAITLTEPFVGSDASGLETTARREGDEYILNGKKRYITNLGYADIYMVYARTSDNPEDIAARRHLTGFIVEKGMPGFTIEKINELCVYDPPTLNGYLNFDNVRVPVQNRIAEEGKAWNDVLMRGLNFERVIVCAALLGAMRVSLTYAVYSTQRRIQFDQRTFDFESNQYRISDIIMNLKLSRLMTYYSAYLVDQGMDPMMEATLLKIFAAESNSKAAINAMRCMGGDSVTKFYPVEAVFRNIMMNEIGGGSSDVMRILLARMATRYKIGFMLKYLEPPRRRTHPELGVPIPTFDPDQWKPKFTSDDPEVKVLEALAEDYRVNPGLYMTREELQEDTELDDEALDEALVILEEKELVKLYRMRNFIRLAKATYPGLKKAKPQEYYKWLPRWVEENLDKYPIF